MKAVRILGSYLILTAAVVLSCVGCSEDAERASVTTNPPLLIEPNVAVGKVRAGMSVQDVLNQLGEPQRRTANALEYTRLGFAIMPGTDGTVHVVMCGDVTGINGPLVKTFTGTTKEGMGMNSTREDLLKVYGEPTSRQKLLGGTESFRYDPLGITFTLEGGKVYHMIVRLPSSPEPDRSVTLEPAPGTTQK
jgi:hypothetical protein